MRLEHLSVLNGAKGFAYDTKLLHDGSAHGHHDPTDVDAASRVTVYDEIYTGSGGVDHWNSTGTAVRNLQDGDTVHFVHLDGKCIRRHLPLPPSDFLLRHEHVLLVVTAISSALMNPYPRVTH